MQFITSEGGLTGAGYGLFLIVTLLAVALAWGLAARWSERKRLSARQIAFCGMGLALAYATSYVTLIKMPYGGRVTLFSMLFIVLIGYWYGVGTGIMVGLAYGILQFLQDPYYLSFIQVCCDYLFAFAALGLGGLFRRRRHGLVIGYVTAVIARGIFASIAGYAFWLSYMPESFPRILAGLYPIIYNYMYLGLEMVLTLLLLALPAVRKALGQVGRIAKSQ